MALVKPILASEHNAARLLDMKPAQFRKLVEDGHFPKPREVAGIRRWDVEELRQIFSGEAAEGMGDIKW